MLIGDLIDNRPIGRKARPMVRRVLETRLRALARKFPVVTVTGPRQSGKTTLCLAVFPDKSYASLEAPDV